MGAQCYVAKDALVSAEGFARMFPGLERSDANMGRRLRIRPERPRG